MARHGLSQLPRKLVEHTGQPAAKYRQCYEAAVEARIPAMFGNGRWTWDDGDIDQIAAAFGMSAAKPIKSARKTRSALIAA